MAVLAPSILGADFTRLGEEIASAEQAGVTMYHLDIMDGHFVPNISYGPGVVKTINGLTGAFLDTHLMLSEPEKFFEPFADAGSDSITFHYQVHPQPEPYARQVHDLGMQAGLSVNPDIRVEKAWPHLEHFEYFLIMSVFPGFGGQKFIEDSIDRIARTRDFIDRNKLNTRIQVDGGVDAHNAARVVEAGADVLVMGTAFFGSDDRAGLVRMVSGLSKVSEGRA
jgi:ribulose-phosphate 3-epimerase